MSQTPNGAVMFDIDDTLIRSIDNTLMTDVVTLLNFARGLRYTIIIITARGEISRQYTESQLEDASIKYDKLIFASAASKGEVKRGMDYNFVLSVGDLFTDCTDTMFGLKLPGPNDPRGVFYGPSSNSIPL